MAVHGDGDRLMKCRIGVMTGAWGGVLGFRERGAAGERVVALHRRNPPHEH